MKKFFNIAGPCNKEKHYIVPVLERIPEVGNLIDREQYFVLHAARQTGKTTFIKTLVNKLNNEDNYYALYCSLESVQIFTEAETGIPQILDTIKLAIELSDLPHRETFAINADNSQTSILIRLMFLLFSNLQLLPSLTLLRLMKP